MLIPNTNQNVSRKSMQEKHASAVLFLKVETLNDLTQPWHNSLPSTKKKKKKKSVGLLSNASENHGVIFTPRSALE